MIHFQVGINNLILIMYTIGLRASPTEVTYAIYDSEAKKMVSVDEIIYPKAMTAPEALKYIRNTVLDIIREYKISRAGIRTIESTSMSVPIDRIQIEGVIQEALASSAVEKYYFGRIASIAAKVGIQREEFKTYLQKDANYAPVGNWAQHSEKEKEAIFTALGAVNA